MAECVLPPLDGVLCPADAPPRKWQRFRQALGLPEGLLALAWSLAGVPQTLANEARRELALVLLALLVNEAQGSTCLPVADEGACLKLARALGEPRLPLQVLDLPELDGFITEGAGQGPLVRAAGLLSSRRLFQAEADLAEAIRQRAAAPRNLPALDEELLTDPVRLSEEQREAVASALSGRLALLTGGPGTGKTSIVVAILRAALRLGCRPGDLALAAPTGKAAHRMAAAIHQARARIARPATSDDGLLDPAAAPQTLHRLLGYLPSGDRFRHHAGNPLKARVLVVDEASMVDAVMMGRLLQALAPDATLVLIGDADQLPSVEAGTAFRDLVAGLPELTVRLTHSYRMQAGPGSGAAVLTAARKVNGDQAGGLFEAPHPVAVRSGIEEVQGRGVELLDTDEAGLRAYLDRWLRQALHEAPGYLEGLQHTYRLASGAWAEGDSDRLQALFALVDRARLLCPVREASGLRGTVPLNAYLHARVQDLREQGMQKRLAFSLGEPVMMTRNDPARGISNGDQGLLLRVSREGAEPRLEVVFPIREGFRAFTVAPLLGELELAYALTVHKAQGSEFDHVTLVLPKADAPFATREVLYTALTRARHGVTVLGSPEAVEAAAARSLQRCSRLGRTGLGETRPREIGEG
jgi:exodeoxyribonuclease V alpha subunit